MQLFDGRYEQLTLLGRGTFGEVWKVRDVETGKVEALKIYTSATSLGQESKSFFTHEFALLADANHPNLLTPRHYDISKPEGYPYLVLKYCDKGNITNLVGKFDERLAWQLIHDMASALAYLHALRPPVIHQDIKPENILLDGDYFMLSDFGVSTQVKPTDKLSADIEAELRSAGTIAYMAPEKFSEHSMPFMANDIWSLGATVFEMLSGQLPFGNDGGLLQKEDTILPSLPAQFSEELRATIGECLAYEPRKRPFAEVLEEKAKTILDSLQQQDRNGQDNKDDRQWTPPVPPEPTPPVPPEPTPPVPPEPTPPYPPTPNPSKPISKGFLAVMAVAGLAIGVLLALFV